MGCWCLLILRVFGGNEAYSLTAVQLAKSSLSTDEGESLEPVTKWYFLVSFSDGKLYDAYVIYPRVFEGSSAGTTSVEYFVHRTLPDVLEKKCGYKLCIYGRDLLPGQGKGCHHGLGIEIHWKKVWKGDQERVMLGNERDGSGAHGTGKRKGIWGSSKRG